MAVARTEMGLEPGLGTGTGGESSSWRRAVGVAGQGSAVSGKSPRAG